MVRPGKLDDVLQRTSWAWYQREVNLWEDAIVGPFDFSTKREDHKKPETHRVPNHVWNKLKTEGAKFAIPTDDMEAVLPLFLCHYKQLLDATEMT